MTLRAIVQSVTAEIESISRSLFHTISFIECEMIFTYMIIPKPVDIPSPVLARGSTQETKLYTRVLRTYYASFNKQFIINVLITEGDGYAELPFEPKANLKFLGFLIKRIH